MENKYCPFCGGDNVVYADFFSIPLGQCVACGKVWSGHQQPIAPEPVTLKFCPAGKIECVCFVASMIDTDWDVCWALHNMKIDREFNLHKIDVCPIPSRQQPIATNIIEHKYLDCMHHLECENAGENVCRAECRDFKISQQPPQPEPAGGN